MRLGMSLKDILLSLVAGIAAGLIVVSIMAQFSPVGGPVRATLVNCAAVRARSRQGTGTPQSAELRRAERRCAEAEAAATPAPQTQPTQPAQLAQPAQPARSGQEHGTSIPQQHAARQARSHGWRKAATPPAN